RERLPIAAEQYPTAIRRPAHGQVGPGMPGDASRFPPFGWDHIDIRAGGADEAGTIVLAAVSDPFPVGREDRLPLVAAIGQTARRPAGARRAPQITAPG